MKHYGNKTGESPIVGYEIGKNSIVVVYSDGNKYLYTFEIPGKRHVLAMMELAEKGEGLSTYISKYVRENYESKL